jgi:asparagine synthetase B (glutamine-hydrolysing)
MDAVGYWQDEAADLGHALAAVTPGALHEQQPLVDSASGCVIVFDGRLDN